VEKREYERLAATEERMWWFRGLHANLVTAFRRAGDDERRSTTILDAGCGTGGLLVRLGAAFPRATIIGIDIDPGAAAMAKGKSGRPTFIGSIDRLPFATASLNAVFSADVLCHRGVDERGALDEFFRCLRPGGAVILNLPAYRWLYSEHDAAVDNARRYTRAEVLRLLSDAGFTGIRIGYWNTFLFPVMVLRRKLWRHGTTGPQSDVALSPAPIEWAFSAVMAFENWLLMAGISLPFGGSILAIAVKP
jgi:SAM-dependent methyltransferase